MAGEVKTSFSLARLFSQLEVQLGHSVEVGGRLSVSGSKLKLLGQGSQSLRLMGLESEFSSIRPNDFVLLRGVVSRGKLDEVTLEVQGVSGVWSSLGPSKKWANAFEWSHFLGDVKASLTGIGLFEVQTPTIVACPGPEPTIQAFDLDLKDHLGVNQKMHLRTSPELHLKKLLSSGLTDIFEIGPSYRDEEGGELHRNEFCMLEWYRSFAKLPQIKRDLLTLMSDLAQQEVGISISVSESEAFLNRDGRERAIESFRISDVFKKGTGFDLTPETSVDELQRLAQKLGVSNSESHFVDLYHLLFMNFVEPILPQEGCYFLEDYPPQLAALAEVGEGGWAQRFEFYWDGVEIANAFFELRDPQEQRRRFEEDFELRKKFGKRVIGSDESFFEALEMGLPPCSGVALGLDRLYMKLKKQRDIFSLRPF